MVVELAIKQIMTVKFSQNPQKNSDWNYSKLKQDTSVKYCWESCILQILDNALTLFQGYNIFIKL